MHDSVSSAAWAAEELATANFGDARLNKRLIRIVTDKLAKPTASIPQASGNWAATKATYRFFASHQVRAEAIRAPHRDATVQRILHHATILVLQDTTELDYTRHPNTTGLGHLDNTHGQGLKVHSGLAVTVDGVPLGLLHQAAWTRDAATKNEALPTPSGEPTGVEVLRLLTDETRWRLLQALRTSDRQVNELVERTGLPQNLVSYHLGLLRQAGLLQVHKSDADARVTYYGVYLAALIDIGHQHAKHIDALAQLRPDIVVTVCDIAREECPVWLQAATHLHWSIADPVAVTAWHSSGRVLAGAPSNIGGVWGERTWRASAGSLSLRRVMAASQRATASRA